MASHLRRITDVITITISITTITVDTAATMLHLNAILPNLFAKLYSPASLYVLAWDSNINMYTYIIYICIIYIYIYIDRLKLTIILNIRAGKRQISTVQLPKSIHMINNRTEHINLSLALGISLTCI